MFNSYYIITAIIIGVTQGITEFLPISSTGHIIIICHFLEIENFDIKTLLIFVQIGSVFAILYFFHKRIFLLLNIKRKKTKILHFLLAIFPTVFFGLTFYKKIKILFNINNVIYGLILGSALLIISEIFKPKKYKTSSIDDINLFQSIIIGLFQVFSLYPGFSRLGATMASGMLLGIKKSVAIEFSFIISIPLIIGSCVFDLIKDIENIKKTDPLIFIISIIISFIISIFCIKMMMNMINKISMIFFGIYRCILASLIYWINEFKY